ncbi:hypothetical protein [Paracoccus liaowanqingii]|nr:hypothetical protein [Paracoccus liaowanqingii]
MARVLIPSGRLDAITPDSREEGREDIPPSSPPDASVIKALRDELSKAQQQVIAAEAKADERAETIADLRARLNQEGEERRRLTAILTDQKAPPPNQDRPFWRRFFS